MIVTNNVNKINGVQALTIFFAVKTLFSSVNIFASATNIFFGVQNFRNMINASKLMIAEETLTSSGPTKLRKMNWVTEYDPPDTKIAGKVSLIPLNPSTINTIKNETIIVTKTKTNDVFLPSVNASRSVSVAGTVTGIPMAP